MTKPIRKHLVPFTVIGSVFIMWTALCITSCGYRTVRANLVGGGKRISVPMVQNYTAYKGLAGPLTSALRKRIARAGLEVTENSPGSLRLEVKIVLVESDPGMLTVNNGNLDAVDSILSIHARASLVDFGGYILEGPYQFEVGARAYAGGNPIFDRALERRELKSLLDDLAQNIAAHFLST